MALKKIFLIIPVWAFTVFEFVGLTRHADAFLTYYVGGILILACGVATYFITWVME